MTNSGLFLSFIQGLLSTKHTDNSELAAEPGQLCSKEHTALQMHCLVHSIGFVCTSWLCLCPLWDERLCILHSPLEERLCSTVCYNSYLDVGNWELGEWCKAQTALWVVFVESLMWICVQHAAFLNNHSKTLNWYRQGI